MTTLNATRGRAAQAAGAHGMTDVTGFGLLGHLHELALASGVAAEVEAGAVPAIEGVWSCWATNAGDRGRNRNNGPMPRSSPVRARHSPAHRGSSPTR